MKNLFTPKIIRIIWCTVLIITTATNYAQQIPGKLNGSPDYDNFDIKNASFLLPGAHPSWHYYQSLSFSYVDIPAAWALEKINAPLLTYSGKFSLPGGFDMQASLATIYVSNRLSFGPFWNYSIHNYHFGVGYLFAYDFGHLNQSGYKTKLKGWEQQPTITAGYSFKKVAVILRGELYLTKSIDFVEGGHSVPMWDSFVNGYSITASVEQRLYRNKMVSVGIRLNSIRYHFLAWPAFPVNQNRYLVPEFQIGIRI